MTPELLHIRDRRQILLQMKSYLIQGYREPGLLYLGARYAISLGLSEEAEIWIDKLISIWEEDKSNKNYLPIALLQIFGLGQKKSPQQLYTEINKLTGKLNGNNNWANQIWVQLLQNSPEQLIKDPQISTYLPLLRPGQNFINNFQEKSLPDIELFALHSLSEQVQQYYNENLIDKARYSLEEMLLLKGDQPSVLSNLIIITAEQQDIEAYERYWRRYVQLLLWNIFSGDSSDWARKELISFYSTCSNNLFKESDELPQKLKDILGCPGFLNKWVEVHVGLILLQKIGGPKVDPTDPKTKNTYLLLTQLWSYWLETFYPKFLCRIEMGDLFPFKENLSLLPNEFPLIPLQFDPTVRFIHQFISWSRIGFGLEKDASPYLRESIIAYSDCISRIPIEFTHNFWKEMAHLFKENDIEKERILFVIRETCDFGIGLKTNDYFQNKENPDWKGLEKYLSTPYQNRILTTYNSLLYTMSLLNQHKTAQALSALIGIGKGMKKEEVGPEHPCYKMFFNILAGIIQKKIEKTKKTPKKTVSELKEIQNRFQDLPSGEKLKKFKEQMLDEIKKALDHIEQQAIIDEALKDYQNSMEKKQFSKAKLAVKKIPDYTDELKDLKKDLRKQISDAEKHEKLQQELNDTIKIWQDLIKKGDFAGARKAINTLPDEPSDIKKIKEDLRRQTEEAENHTRLQKNLDNTIKKWHDLIKKGDFAGARKVIYTLPDSPPEIKKIKEDLQEETKKAISHREEQNRIDRQIKRIQELVSNGNFFQARIEARSLPGPLRQNLLNQIDQAEEYANIQKTIQKTVENVQYHLSNGDLYSAKQEVLNLPDHPDAMKQQKMALLNQLNRL